MSTLTTPSNNPPVALTIAGSDCSAGAGIQADLKTFLQHQVHGLSTVTSVVAETPLEVKRINDVDIATLQAQVNILLENYPVAAVKTGMLPTRAAVIAVVELLKASDAPLVVDPVMIATSGAALIDEGAVDVLTSRLLPMATVITPNIPEANFILGSAIEDEQGIEKAARAMSEKFKTSCLLKGGHLAGGDELLDVLCHDGELHTFRHPKQEGSFHGTGCTLSAAIAANLAHGKTIPQAVEESISYLQQLITQAAFYPAGEKQLTVLGW